MPTHMAIVKDILSKTRSSKDSDFSDWHIGLSQDIQDQKDEWADTMDLVEWSQWQSASLEEAKKVLSYFLQKGMKDVSQGRLHEKKKTYIYIF